MSQILIDRTWKFLASWTNNSRIHDVVQSLESNDYTSVTSQIHREITSSSTGPTQYEVSGTLLPTWNSTYSGQPINTKRKSRTPRQLWSTSPVRAGVLGVRHLAGRCHILTRQCPDFQDRNFEIPHHPHSTTRQFNYDPSYSIPTEADVPRLDSEPGPRRSLIRNSHPNFSR